MINLINNYYLEKNELNKYIIIKEFVLDNIKRDKDKKIKEIQFEQDLSKHLLNTLSNEDIQYFLIINNTKIIHENFTLEYDISDLSYPESNLIFRSLQDILENRIQKYSDKNKLELINNLIKCINVLHKYNIEHCYITSQNFLIYNKTNVKFIDYNLSCNLPSWQNNYNPPEKLINQLYNSFDIKKCDIFVLGLIILQIIWGEHPFSSFINYYKLRLFYTRHLLDFVIDNLTFSQSENIIKKMLNLNSLDRPTIKEVQDIFDKIILIQSGGNDYDIPVEYKKQKEYGEGGTAKVIGVLKKDNPIEKYVIKIIKNIDTKYERLINNEIHVLKKIKTSGCKNDLLCYENNIIKNNYTYIITKEFSNSQTLFSYLHTNRNKLNVRIITTIMKNLLNALIKLHNMKIIHSDVKPDNILINNNLDIQLIDFGYAHDIENKDIPFLNGGTYGYEPPEIIRYYQTKKDFHTIDLYKYDIFSLGIVFYELLNGLNEPTTIFENNDNFFLFFKHYELVSRSKYPELDIIINQMLKYHLHERTNNLENILNQLNEIPITTIPKSTRIDFKSFILPSSSNSRNSTNSSNSTDSNNSNSTDSS